MEERGGGVDEMWSRAKEGRKRFRLSGSKEGDRKEGMMERASMRRHTFATWRRSSLYANMAASRGVSTFFGCCSSAASSLSPFSAAADEVSGGSPSG